MVWYDDFITWVGLNSFYYQKGDGASTTFLTFRGFLSWSKNEIIICGFKQVNWKSM